MESVKVDLDYENPYEEEGANDHLKVANLSEITSNLRKDGKRVSLL